LTIIPKSKSLAFQLTIWYIVILGIIVVLAGAFLYQGFKKGLMSDLDADLFEIAEGLNTIWQRRGVTWDEALAKAETQFKNADPFLLAIERGESQQRAGEKIYRADRVPPGAFVFDREVYDRAEARDWDHLLYLTVSHKALSPSPVRVVFLPLRGETIIQAGVSMARINGELARLALIMALAGILLLALASLGGIFIIRKALRPVRSVVEAARRINADDLSLRIETGNRRDEIGALVDTFNEMIARLEMSIKKIRQFSGDVSHELRTPLTIIRGEIEVLQRKDRTSEEYRQMMISVLEETARMNKIIDDLLFLSRLEALAKIDFAGPVLLDEVLVRSFESRELPARRKGVSLVLRDAVSLRVCGEENLLERLIFNLMDNAIRYTPAGGKIDVSLTAEAGFVVLRVQDSGIGIPDASLPFLFDRFYVVDKSRSKESGGSGLGLAIVKEVVDAHRATIEVRSRPGDGTTFIVRFPEFRPE
jgi:heavy metal sensor kinase